MRQTEFFVILGYFLPFHPTNDPENQNFWKTEKNTGRYYHFTYVYYKWQSSDVWFLRYGPQRTEFFVNPKNRNFEKITKKPPKNLIFIILHKCIKNQDHVLHCFWDTSRDRCNIYFSFWAIFCIFNPPHPPKLTTWKIIILKKWDIAWRSSIYIWIHKIIITWYTVPERWCARDGRTDEQTEKVK